MRKSKSKRINSISRQAFWVAGLFSLGALFFFVGTYKPSLIKNFGGLTASIIKPSEKNQFALNRELQIKTAGPFSFRNSALKVNYQSEMNADETLPVDVIYEVNIVNVDTPEINTTRPPTSRPDISSYRVPVKALDGELELNLTSSGFEIAPSDTMKKSYGEPLPIKQIWTITPKAEGNRYMLLKIEEKNIKGDYFFIRDFLSSASINDKEIEPDENGYYKLPVKIKTLWGLSKRFTLIIGWILALLSTSTILALILTKLGIIKTPSPQ